MDPWDGSEYLAVLITVSQRRRSTAPRQPRSLRRRIACELRRRELPRRLEHLLHHGRLAGEVGVDVHPRVGRQRALHGGVRLAQVVVVTGARRGRPGGCARSVVPAVADVDVAPRARPARGTPPGRRRRGRRGGRSRRDSSAATAAGHVAARRRSTSMSRIGFAASPGHRRRADVLDPGAGGTSASASRSTAATSSNCSAHRGDQSTTSMPLTRRRRRRARPRPAGCRRAGGRCSPGRRRRARDAGSCGAAAPPAPSGAR